MSKIAMIKSVLKEYGLPWLIDRMLYSGKLKLMATVPATDRLFEKPAGFPKRLDIFLIDVEDLRSFLRERLNDADKEQLIGIADKACKGVITGFSSIDLDYGNPIDWQLNPLTGKRCDEEIKWYRIPDFDKDRGDIKVIWEASRFSHFITFARAYLLTDDKKYYEAFRTQLHDWLDKNPYSYGANYKCGQECSLRMVNALLAYNVFEKCGLVVPTNTGDVKYLVDRCYRKVLSNFFYAYKCIKNNHTVSELLGMIVGAWSCGDDKQLDKAYRLLDEVIDEQFTDDGGYCQFSFNYQRLALQDIEVVISLSNQTRHNLNSNSIDKIGKAAELMYQCQDESGDMPNYGSNDGALVFPVTSCGYRDFRPVINTTYAMTTGKQLYEDDIHQEELIWFLGGKSIQDYDHVRKDRNSSQFLNAGLFTLRNPKSWMMIVSNDYHSRPGHMDQNHIDLWLDEVNVLCDAGTYSYSSEEGKVLVRNDSHNTAVVDGIFQMNTSGPFMIYDRTKRVLGKCDNDIFRGKCLTANGYTHIRVARKKGNSYEIRDSVDKDYSIMFHTPCEVRLNGNTAYLINNGCEICTIKSSGEMSAKKSNRSLYYLEVGEINCLVIKGKANQEIRTIIIRKGEKND